MNPGFQCYLNDYAKRSFRDVADQDYIVARICYRLGFDENFKWNALQAIEKYLKAILLFNGTSAKGLGHDICEALKRVESIPDLEFNLEHTRQRCLISFLNDYGRDRYLSQSTYLNGEELLELDQTVWNIRHYCYCMRQTLSVKGETISLLDHHKAKVASTKDFETRYLPQISDGLLERIISKRLPGYDDLVWKNFYYGRRRKRRIKDFTCRISGKSPTHCLHPEIFPELCRYVDFPKTVKSQFADQGAFMLKTAKVQFTIQKSDL